ncbi:MAG: hypothetical protein JEY94_07555 [Melioribacteraceae bacterium]|nr:hypothetical protein [Melioribacteraceae bacterium]
MNLILILLMNLLFQNSDYSETAVQKIDVVMLGNSLTHGGNWNMLLKRNNIAEQGIESDSLKGFINRVNEVIKLRPRLCFVMGGINDIYKWRNTREIFSDYKILLNKLKKAGIEPVIQSTLLTGKKYPHSGDRNKEVVNLNELLKKYALIRKVKFIDLNKKMSEDGFLKEDLTWDGVHLNKNGYKIWSKEIDAVLLEKKI